jgi:hypothetical protein
MLITHSTFWPNSTVCLRALKIYPKSPTPRWSKAKLQESCRSWLSEPRSPRLRCIAWPSQARHNAPVVYRQSRPSGQVIELQSRT